ncbi:hypothetical protein N7468_010002 [Penicillium chermesinum]|uniref:Calcium uniporter protein, mitochondrial n=1 Tax=Penicillium chermesinum TaxID=63820 RepID=A0A9W9TC44_9EURO|nr:uncharacterized protein N7468_010002 [Penicillium chermesinum]KAJ5216994.1 hypothetical protein N7468_010002 [Penicillium chermesinum]
MRLPTAPLLSPVRHCGWSRAATPDSLIRRLGPNYVYNGQRRLSSQGRQSGGGLLPRLHPPRTALGSQVRSFKKANYIEKISDHESAEELLEALEVRDDEKDTSSHRKVIEELENGPKRSAEKRNDLLTEHMTKGKMLTTPSRLFKLIIPLTTIGKQGHDKGIIMKDPLQPIDPHSQQENTVIEPIAILVHPQQPLSYLERLIQSELPPIKGEKETLRAPAVSFVALQHEDNAIKPKKRIEDDEEAETIRRNAVETEYQAHKDQGKVERRRRSREEDAETYSYPRKTDSSLDSLDGQPERFVRWSQATEVGDFIRDAARTREFIVMIEGAPSGLGQIRITVPSFNERTYFLRARLRKLSRRIQSIAEIKNKCDMLAHRGAQRVAIGGFGILSVWWYSVYKLTFETDLGWDTMEPVTYLVSLSTLMGGLSVVFISYKSALDFTVSARQKKLYQQHGVDVQLWESLIDEGKTLRREIKSIAAEYDAEWNERADEQDEQVTQVLKSDKKEEEAEGKEKSEKDRDD